MLTNPCDPLSTLPALVTEELCKFLAEEDLLSCRRVCRRWRELLEASSVWRRFLDPPRSGLSWQRYLSLRRVRSQWRRADFDSHRLTLPPNTKVASGSEYIYAANICDLVVYNAVLDVCLERSFTAAIEDLSVVGNTLAVLTGSTSSKFNITVYKGLEERGQMPSCSRIYALNSEGRLISIQQSKLTVSDEGVILKEYTLPGEVTGITVHGDELLVLTVHPTFRGGGYSVYRTKRHGWELFFERVNSCPVIVPSGRLISNGRQLVLVELIFGERYLFKLRFLDEGSNWIPLCCSSQPFFKADIDTKRLLYTSNEDLLTNFCFETGGSKIVAVKRGIQGLHIRDSDSILVYPNYFEYWTSMERTYTVSLPPGVQYSNVQRQSLVFLAHQELVTYVIKS